MIEVGNLKTKKGEIVKHKGKPWLVERILISARVDRGRKAYIQACPIYQGQALKRSSKTFGDDWK